MALARPDMKEGPGWTWRTQSNKKTNHVSAKHVSANMLLQQDMFELTCCKQVFFQYSYPSVAARSAKSCESSYESLEHIQGDIHSRLCAAPALAYPSQMTAPRLIIISPPQVRGS